MKKTTSTRHLLLFCFILMTASSGILASSNVWEGLPVPQFTLNDQNGITKTNDDFKGKWLVLYFYPKDKTPGCTVEAKNFTADYSKYETLNTNIAGVSLDDVESHKDFADTYNMPFTLLADTDSKLSEALKVKKILPWPHASRQTFLVNPQGIIVQHFAKVDPKTHSEELLKAIKKHQGTAKKEPAQENSKEKS
ncbi:MAG: peroxiredoxin [Gammaproteobacteria bacterium]|nr:peroxiredoxin [Gammaproteobacteria bacterium]MDH5630744.1 peroxiredoxin [Gammaproteobacteria bacterium]